MKLTLSRTSAAAGARAAMTARLFYGLTVEASDVHNGAWLSALAGAALALPAVWLLRRAFSGPRRADRGLCLLLAAAIAVDAASALDFAAFSAGYVAFNHTSKTVLMLPLLLAAARCVCLGGDAVGASAALWGRFVAALVVLIVVLQAPFLHAAWLAPVLGYGSSGLVRAALRAAGWTTLISGACAALASEGEAPGLKDIARDLLFAAVAAAALILLRLMMTPTPDAEGMQRVQRLDSLLTNGRAPLYVQLPMIVAWFLAMTHLLCFECFAAAALLKRCFPGWKDGLCAAAGVLAVAAAALSGLPAWPAARFFADRQLIWITSAGLLSLAVQSLGGGVSKCASDG